MSFSELVVAPALCLPFILSSSVHLTDRVHICDCLSLHPAVSVLACLSEHFIILFSVRVCSSTRFVSLLLCFAFFIFSFFFFFLKCWPVSMLLFYSSPSSFLSLHYLLHLSSCPFQFLSPCPPICWSCPDYSAEGGSSPSNRPSPRMFPTLSPIHQDFLHTQSLHLSAPLGIFFPFLQPYFPTFIHRLLPASVYS